MSPTYTARCVRSEGWWTITVETPVTDGRFAPSIHTQARRLDQIDAVAREATALALDVDEGSFALKIVTTYEPQLVDAVDDAVAARDAATAAAAAAADATRRAVTVLVAGGFAQRDVGELLGISFQRVSQLASSR